MSVPSRSGLTLYEFSSIYPPCGRDDPEQKFSKITNQTICIVYVTCCFVALHQSLIIPVEPVPEKYRSAFKSVY